MPKQLNRDPTTDTPFTPIFSKSLGQRVLARSTDGNHGLITRPGRRPQISLPNQVKPVDDVHGTPPGRLGGPVMVDHRIQAIHHIAPLDALVLVSLDVKGVEARPGPSAIGELLGAWPVAGFARGDLQEPDGAGGCPHCAACIVDFEAVRTGCDWAAYEEC